jgi:hypothetical protein
VSNRQRSDAGCPLGKASLNSRRQDSRSHTALCYQWTASSAVTIADMNGGEGGDRGRLQVPTSRSRMRCSRQEDTVTISVIV